MIPGTWVEIPLNYRGLSEINTTGKTVMWARSVAEAIGYEPSWAGSNAASYIKVDTAYGGGYEPELVVEYTTGNSSRTVATNTNAGEGGSGNDLTEINWMTPRCIWDDETPGFEILGEAGCPFRAKVTNGALTIAEITGQTIKTDGTYYWYPDIQGYSGNKLRCEATETTAGHTDTILSTWGWSESYVDAGACESWSKYMEQKESSWRRSEKDYRIGGPAEVLKFYWASNMVEGDIADCELDLRQAGATQRSIYNSTIADLLDNYYLCEDADNDNLISSRYILASMGDVTDTLDGLIIDLDNSLVNANKGIYYLNISQLDDYKLDAVSGYLYMAQNELSITESYEGEGDYQVAIDNSVNIGFQANLSAISLEIKEGELSRQTTDDTLDSSAKIIMAHWLGEGDWNLLLTLSKTGENFEYRRLWDATQGPGGEEGGGGGGFPMPGDWWDWLTTGVGRWVLLILCIALEALMFHKHKEVVVILACCLLAVWIVLEWVDLWLVVLLALGAGLSVWAMLRRKTQGGNE